MKPESEIKEQVIEDSLKEFTFAEMLEAKADLEARDYIEAKYGAKTLDFYFPEGLPLHDKTKVILEFQKQRTEVYRKARSSAGSSHTVSARRKQKSQLPCPEGQTPSIGSQGKA